MNLFDIIGPVMIGPSSSHTAGAVRLGNAAKAILGETVAKAVIGLHGSFAQTGKGHGTDIALIAGLMGWGTDDLRIPQAYEYAKEVGLAYAFKTIDMGKASHPNLAKFWLTGVSGNSCEVVGSSVGGGRIVINEMDGFPLEFSGEYHTLVIMHTDRPGAIQKVTDVFASHDVNIAQMKVFRRDKGGVACMVIETDQALKDEELAVISALPILTSVRRIKGIG